MHNVYNYDIILLTYNLKKGNMMLRLDLFEIAIHIFNVLVLIAIPIAIIMLVRYLKGRKTAEPK